MLSDNDIKSLEKLCKENRKNILKMVYNAQSGHIGGAMSAVELLTVLYHKCMNICPKWTKDENFANRDRFVLSKGHASSVLYSVLSQLGYFPKEELMTFRLFGSRLQGHPVPVCPGIDVATGSLGQGLSVACGMAMGLKLDKIPQKYFALWEMVNCRREVFGKLLCTVLIKNSIISLQLLTETGCKSTAVPKMLNR